MNELKPIGFETADALDRFRAVRRGMPYKTLWPSDLDEAIEALGEKIDRRPAPENKPLTLEQLRQMDGNPIWISGLERWGILGRRFVRIDNKLSDADYRLIVGFDYGWEWIDDVLRGNRKAYARKPEGSA